jgi:membrane protein implicated in regulation of membrane protease activity
MDKMMIVWLVAFAVFLVAEISTQMLVSVWLACGSLAALLTAGLGGQVWLQILVFVAVSALALAFTRPLARKLIGKRERTNADRCVGQTALVTEDIDNLEGQGAVRLDGKTWTARSDGGEPLPKGQSVRVLRIEGVKLMVEAEKKQEEVTTHGGT